MARYFIRMAAIVTAATFAVSVQGFAPQMLVKSAFTTSQRVAPMETSSSSLHMMELFDPATVSSASAMMDSASTLMSDAASGILSSSNFLSFTDQGQNLAGTFFQASLLPYLLFLYFLSFRANRISELGNFGFQFILIFVLSTIPSGIITKSIYGLSLANTDWLHGSAETLLTVANVLVVSMVLHDRICLRAYIYICTWPISLSTFPPTLGPWIHTSHDQSGSSSREQGS
jgi:hypothetical protein